MPFGDRVHISSSSTIAPSMTMPDTSTSPNGNPSATTEIAAIFKELQSAEKTADAIEGRLDLLEKRLDELLATLEREAEAEAGALAEGRTTRT